MTDYISREAALADLEQCNRKNSTWTPQRVKTLLMRLPSADAVPVQHKQWLGRSGLFQGKCSACGYLTYDKTADWARKYWPHCPICGSKMDLEDENGT